MNGSGHAIGVDGVGAGGPEGRKNDCAGVAVETVGTDEKSEGLLPHRERQGRETWGKAKLEKDHSKKSVENQDTPTFARFYLFVEGPEGQRRAEKVLLRDLLVCLPSSGFPAMREDEVIKSCEGGASLL